MKPSDKHLSKIVSLARKAASAPRQPESQADIRFFANRTAAAWSRQRSPAASPDPLGLWERVGQWSLAGAAALVLLAAVFHQHAPPPNPFEPFGPDAAEETLFF
jgi:hypothetical protein